MQVQLLQDYLYKAESVKFPCAVQQKVDGWRMTYTAKHSHFISRTNTSHAIPQGFETLQNTPEGIVLDGEISCGCLESTSLESPNVCFHVFDIFVEENPNMPFADRFSLLRSLPIFSDKVRLVECSECADHGDIQNAIQTAKASQHEGIVIRSKQAAYKAGKRTINVMKYKCCDLRP